MTDSGLTAESRETLWSLIEDIRVAMFTSRQTEGQLRSCPMTTQNSAIDQDASLWFFTSRHGAPATDIVADASVNISYAEPRNDSYVSISGTASVVEDMTKKKQLWTKLAQAWFPGGVDDPDLALIKVDIVAAHYWDVKDNKAVQLFKMARAAVTGKPPRNMGEHGEVRMR